MIKAIREVDPKKADELEKTNTSNKDIKKFIDDHNFKVRG